MAAKFSHYRKDITLLEPFTYKSVTVPAGFKSDGITTGRFGFFLLGANMYSGIEPAILHDYLCENKHLYSREFSTKLFVELWQKHGLGHNRAKVVAFLVNTYQRMKGWQ